MRSKDDGQLHGEIEDTLGSNCKDPYRFKTTYNRNQSFTFKIAPCGAIANSLFNGVFNVCNSVSDVWCRGIVIKRANSQHRDYEFEASTCHNWNTVDEEGGGKPRYKIPSLRESSEPWLLFLLCSKSSMRRSAFNQ